MIEIVDGKHIEFVDNLIHRKSEIIEFGLELCRKKNHNNVKVWENKRGDLVGKYKKLLQFGGDNNDRP